MSTNLTFIEQNASKSNITPQKKESKLECVRKLTHLYMHDKYIQRIGNLAACENLQVLYLHNNDILKITGLEPLTTLKSLYLQKNKISKIEGLRTLKNLKKLYLGYNDISVVENLDDLSSLEELHIEKQLLGKGECLCFDPRSIVNIATTLQVLNVSQNNLTTISDLAPLTQLRNLNASYNNLTEVDEIASVIHNWYHLTELNFIGNPMVKKHRYRDNIIANTFRLVILDNKDINETTRQFIKRFEFEKTQNRLNNYEASLMPKELPNVPHPVKKEATRSLLSDIRTNLSTTVLTSTDNVTGTYIPWKALKPSVSDYGKTVPPLFMKQKQQKRPETKRVQFGTSSVFPQMPWHK